jgi:hypothetical protein
MSPASRRVYIDQFTAWYCSELRLAFNRIVVVRYRLHMDHTDWLPILSTNNWPPRTSNDVDRSLCCRLFV